MADYTSKIPKITWGTGFANTLYPGYPLDNPAGYPEPREGSEVLVMESGVRDAWTVDDDEYLEADVRWIPGANGTTPEGNTITGWDGATGWMEFLKWARDQNKFRFYSDKDSGTYHTCYLVEPMKGAPPAESDGTRRIHLKIVDDGTQGAFEGYTYDPNN